MTTFQLTARLQALDTAITAANAQLPAPLAATWLAQLNAERDALNAAPDAAKGDTAFRNATVLWARTLPSAQVLLNTLGADPVYLAPGTPPTIILPVAQAVVNNPNRPSVWGSTPGVSVTMLVELENEGHRWWLNQPEATRPPLSAAEIPLNTIAVLLPVTLETRFYPPDGDHPSCRVLVRVSPDDISLDRHRPNPTGFEVQALGDVRAAWQTQAPGTTLDDFLTNTDVGRAHWRTLCERFTPARAAWLVTTTAGKDLATVQTDDADHPVRVAGFPDRIEVWVTLKGQPAPQKIGEGAPVQHDKLVFDLPRDDADAWWNSWDRPEPEIPGNTAKTAIEVGVGIECPLTFDPEEIETLYVVGLSDETPAGLFANKVASGDFAAIEPGMPTNTVHGEPAVDLATDPGTWGQLMARGLQLAEINRTYPSEHSFALTGDPEALPLFPAPDFDHETFNRILVGALYPALWGHALKDIWGLGPASHAFARWMFAWVRPEGHLLPIGCGDQPYGVVPATSLQRWQLSRLDGSDAAVEPHIVATMTTLRSELAARAEAGGTTIGADTDKLVTLVARTPTSVGYSYQAFWPEELIEPPLGSIPGGGFDAAQQAAFRAEVERRYRPGETVRGDRPQRFYLAIGDRHDIAMPVALPFFFPGVPAEKAPHLDLRERITRFIDVLERLQQMHGIRGFLQEQLQGVLPDSLLFRLLIQSVLHACADAARASEPGQPGGGDGPRLQDLFGNPPPTVWEWAAQLSLANHGQVDVGTPTGQTYRMVAESVDTLIGILQEVVRGPEQLLADVVRRLERVTRNTLDTAATRIDPFVTALAWRRLNTLRDDPTTSYRLGIYGWVERPKFGKDGPLPGGLLHAPSQEQLVTSIILRDRYLAEQGFDGGAGKAWQMSITSRRTRLAEEIAEEVRLGIHIREALGRRAEAILNDSALIQEFRTVLAPMRAAAPDRFQVCDGEKVLRMLAEEKLPPQVTDGQKAQLQEWQDAMDVYSDLLVAQGVYQATTRRADAASGTMNAAAGFGRPPDLEAIQTPRAGQSVLSSLLAVLPFVDMPPLDQNEPQESHPAQLADASVAAYVDSSFGPAADWRWTFSVKGQRKGADGTPEDFQQTQSVALSDLGMVPSDAVLFPPDKLSFALGQVAMDQVAASITDLLTITIDAKFNAVVEEIKERHRVAREVVVVLGGKPFEFHQLHIPTSRASEAETAAQDQDIRANLLVRLRALVAAAEAVDGVLSDPAQAMVGLRLALRWGIAPIDRTMSPADRAIEARGALQARLQKAQDFLDQLDVDAATPNAAGKTPQATASQIAEAINDLAAPEGQLAILSAVNRDQLRNYEPDRPIQPAPHLDEDWLTVLAPLRGRLARLEALQLETLRVSPPAGFTSLVAFANTPADPWQQQAVAQNRERVRQGLALQPPRLIAAYGTANAWDGERVAAGLIDSWNETVPDPRHTTQAGFRFNAPGARAPQAVLLAVPPVVDQLMDTATVVDILRETRELAHARMAVLENLGDYEAVLPTMMLSTPDPWNKILLDPNPFPHM